MEEKLKLVIEKIILPQYPNIIDFTVTTDKFGDRKYNFVFDRPIYKNITTYIVRYYFKDKVDLNKYGKLYENLDDETMSLFDMLGPKEDDEISIEFAVKKL